jgi:hypothetical protein
LGKKSRPRVKPRLVVESAVEYGAGLNPARLDAEERALREAVLGGFEDEGLFLTASV